MVKALRTSVQSGGLRQGGLQPGIGSDNIFATASLDLDFARHKNLGQLVDATTGSNLIDFTRASSGTYVGSDGLIKTATTNYFTYSEDMQSAFSIKSGVQAPMPSNTASGPFSGTLADEMRETATTGGHYIERNTGEASNKTWTHSVYVKRIGNPRIVWLTLYANSYADSITGRFNLDTLFTQATDAGTASAITSFITPIGNEWFRLSVTGIPTTASVNDLRCRIVLINASTIYTGETNTGLYLWGAQLEQSDTVGEYVKTTNTINSAPRFDHDPTTGESLGLLVEELRTNLLLQSEDFSTTWSTINATVTTNQIASPNGTVTADLMSDDGSTPARVRQQVSVVSGQTYTASIYLKAGSQDSVFWREDNEDLIGVGVNLTTGQITTGTGTIDPVGDGWYRVSFSGSVSSSGFWPEVRLNSAGTVYVWGAQLEEGSFPTSYIPTEGSTVTRAADVAGISGSNFSSWYRQDEGTVFANIFNRAIYSGTNSFPYVAQFDDGTNAERISLDHSVLAGGYRTQYVVRDGDVNQASISAQTGLATSAAKWSAAYGLNSFASASNGAVAVTDSSGTVPTVNRLQIGIGFGTQYNGTIRRLVYWDQRLPNDTLETITQ